MYRRLFWSPPVAVLATFLFLTEAGAQLSAPPGDASTGASSAGVPPGMVLGAEVPLGRGTASSFARFDAEGAPLAIGVLLSAGSLDGLPVEPSDGHRCFDHDGSGSIEDGECLGWHERVIPLPSEVGRRQDIPFKWILMNWNPAGHAPAEVYGLPHFDVHYFIDSIERTFSLMPGPCGPEFIRCDQFERARTPVPADFVHADFESVDAVAPAMGNHLVDLTSHEFHGSVFDRTWIYGSYDGRITFYEEMVTRDFLARRPHTCFDIKVAPAFEVAGWYPTRSCYGSDAATGEQTVSIEGFVYREAAAPGASG